MMLLRRSSVAAYHRSFSSAKAKALFVPPNEATWLYPFPIPRSDAAIKKGTEKWRELVHERKYCPFVKSTFGAKYRIEVERSNDSSMWMQRVFSFLEDKQCNTMLLVLPNLLIPTQEHALTMDSLMNQLKMPHTFGAEFISFRVEMSRLGIRQCMPHDNGVLNDVAFHPINGPPNWSPWPIIQVQYIYNTYARTSILMSTLQIELISFYDIILMLPSLILQLTPPPTHPRSFPSCLPPQLFKRDIMQQAEALYQKNTGCPVSKIVMDNFTTVAENMKSPEIVKAMQQELMDCYTEAMAVERGYRQERP